MVKIHPFRNLMYFRYVPYNGRKKVLTSGFVGKGRIKAAVTNHIVEHLTFMYIINGEAEFKDHNNKRHKLYAGDLALRFPNQPHDLKRITPVNDWLEFYLKIPHFLFDYLKGIGVFSPSETVWHVGNGARIFLEIEKFLNVVDVNESPEKLLLATQQLIHMLKNSGFEQSETPLVRAMKLLNNSVQTSISIPEVAEKLGMGYEAFRKYFREQAGISPKRYCLLRKIEQAKNLLADSDFSIKDIAYMLGYQDSSAFSHHFKQEVGLSPGRFRGNCKKM